MALSTTFEVFGQKVRTASHHSFQIVVGPHAPDAKPTIIGRSDSFVSAKKRAIQAAKYAGPRGVAVVSLDGHVFEITPRAQS